MSDKRIVAVVPIKLNNRRLPQKNTRSFTNGQPLCTYILNTLLTVEGLDGVFVYCSNPQIQTYLPDGVTYINRPKDFDTDTTSMSDILFRFAQDISADIYLMTHTTAPFIKKKSIEEGLNAVIKDGYDSAFAAKKLQDFLWSNGRPMNYSLENIPRTQDLPALYEETSGFYIYTAETIRKHHRRIGERPYIVEVGEIEAIDIDEEEDFVIADALYNFLYLSKRKEGHCDE